MKHANSIFRAAVCGILTLSLLVSPFVTPSARAVTQAEIDEVKEKLAQLETQAKAQQEVINELTVNKARVVDRKTALDEKIGITQQQIDLLEQQIALYDEIVRQTGEELSAAQETETTHEQRLRTRMRAMEESGNTSYISFIFAADSVTELLARLADVDDIMHYDQTLEEQYTAARRDVEQLKKNYEQTLTEQEALSREMDRKTEELNAQVDAACSLIANLESQSEDAQAEYDAIAKARADGEAELNALVKKRQEEEAARRAAEEAARRAAQQQQQQQSGGSSSGNTGGGGSRGSAVSLTSLMWPVPSCNIITSRFGYRQSPTAGASSYHGGLDIGAQMSAPILAAQGGTVILASSISGYGNCVMVDHGGGIVTLYGHMSTIACSYGQNVSQGQIVGYVGSTGISTGPHCHFEIRVNGTQTDPAPYFSGLVYYC